MSGGRPAPLRLAHVELRPEVAVVVAPDEPAPGCEALVVQPALASAAQLNTPGRAADRIVVRASLPGLGGRYLVGVARSAAAGGWAAEELAALVVELERRCTYVRWRRWVTARVKIIDEYNRIPTETQSALLSLMAEGYAEQYEHTVHAGPSPGTAAAGRVRTRVTWRRPPVRRRGGATCAPLRRRDRRRRAPSPRGWPI